MTQVSVRELRNHGGDVLQRAEQGEEMTVTRDGRAVARITALPRPALTVTELRRRRRHLTAMDPEALRRDVDAVLDTSL